mgnify:CR=1 FL=1
MARSTLQQQTKQFDALAQAYRCTVESTDGSGRYFTLNVHNRDFKVAQALDDGAHCLITSTPLNSEGWRQHAVQIGSGEWCPPAGSSMQLVRSGDERFDREFVVTERGVGLPGNWLDREVRSLVRQVFALPMKRPSLRAEAGRLAHHTPWHDNEITPRALEELMRRMGWLSHALDIAAMRDGDSGSSNGADAANVLGDDELADEVADKVALAAADRRNKFTLSRNLLSIGGDYTITDESGAKRYFAVGKLRVLAAMFSLQDADRKVLFTGREHVWNLDQKFDIARDGRRHATIIRQLVRGGTRIFGTPTYRYEVTLAGGDKMEATGVFTAHWTLRRRDMTVANVETDGHVSEISLACDARDVPLILTIVMAIVRLNPPARSASTTD